ncbi:MAG: single-stranded-DNA-specific exonuclease RecJ [Thermoguttaceae bacterium]|nr:single-stranded-DNA-specific exonuclease RecJ [Thermoguttaceae bacterium]MDW8080181.1 single-stranded-DNA-specific exonuclease RecJ [Thermoguttaceae bacterium]
MEKVWRFLHPNEVAVGRLQAAGFHPIVARLLAVRGIRSREEADRFLEPKLAYLTDPSELPGCHDAAARILRAIRSGKKITVFGDYDVDGITGLALLCRAIRLLGGDVDFYIPCRIEEGYGLNAAAVQALAENGTQVLVTVDCGISGHQEINLARRHGMEVIVTDHHCLPAELPEAHVIVHPQLSPAAVNGLILSGAGVAFKLAWQLSRLAYQSERLPEETRNFLIHATGLAAVGTIADVIPLLEENRVLVHCGLHALAKIPLLGLRMLLEVAGLPPIQPRDSEKVAYQIAPRLNAAGRLSHAHLAAELLLTDSPDRARQLAEELNDLNRQRQAMEEEITRECWRLFHEEGWQNQPALVLASERWHPGVIGIVAGRLADQLSRPVALIARDSLRQRRAIGSVRGVRGFDVFAALDRCRHLFETYGGHEGAGGFTLVDENIAPFREAFVELAAQASIDAAKQNVLLIEAEVPLGSLVPELVNQLEKLGPFGHGNARPLLCAGNVRLVYPPEACGSAGQHVRMLLSQGPTRMRAIAFRKIHWLEALSAHTGPIDIAFYPTIDEYQGQRTVALQLVDWRPSSREGIC